MCCGRYVITPAYLLFDSLRLLLGVRISCFASPHLQSFLHPWFNRFLSYCELGKMDVSTSPLFPGNSIFLPHTVSLSLSLFLTISFKLSHSWWNPSSTVMLTPPPLSAPFLSCSPHSCTELWAMSWHRAGFSFALHSPPSGGSHRFLFFSCHWLLGRKNAFWVCLQFSINNATLEGTEILQHAQTCD